MTVRAFLVRGLLVGVLAGLSTFVVGYFVAEPHVQAAIDLEEAGSAGSPAGETPAHDHGDDEAGDLSGDLAGDLAGDSSAHTHEEDGTVISRHNQRTWGLLTGSLTVGVVFGGLVALAAAGVVGRIGSLSAGQSTAVVAFVGWVSVALVPFLKYPASPPAVGDPDTIGARSSWFFALLATSVVMAVIAVFLAKRVFERSGAFPAVVTGTGAYVFAMVVVGQVLPTVNELGDFPADTLWYFRRASLIVTGTLWAAIGVLLTAAVRRLHAQESAVTERRQLAASL